MMDDLFYTDPLECQDCHKKQDAGSMVWVNGRCYCPKCYEYRKNIIIDLTTGGKKQ